MLGSKGEEFGRLPWEWANDRLQKWKSGDTTYGKLTQPQPSRPPGSSAAWNNELHCPPIEASKFLRPMAQLKLNQCSAKVGVPEALFEVPESKPF